MRARAHASVRRPHPPHKLPRPRSACPPPSPAPPRAPCQPVTNSSAPCVLPQPAPPNCLPPALLCDCGSYASQRFGVTLADNTRAGFFVGDGAGVGKGRQAAGLILEWVRRGCPRHLWLSIASDLVHDARRDLDDLGAQHIRCHTLKGAK